LKFTGTSWDASYSENCDARNISAIPRGCRASLAAFLSILNRLDDIVLDLCGFEHDRCAVAQELERRWIGVEANERICRWISRTVRDFKEAPAAFSAALVTFLAGSAGNVGTSRKWSKGFRCFDRAVRTIFRAQAIRRRLSIWISKTEYRRQGRSGARVLRQWGFCSQYCIRRAAGYLRSSVTSSISPSLIEFRTAGWHNPAD